MNIVYITRRPRSGDDPRFFDDVFDRKSLEAAQRFCVDGRRRRRVAAVDCLGQAPGVGERVLRQRPAGQSRTAVQDHSSEQAAV